MQNGNEVIYRLKEGYDPLLVCEVILCLCLSVIIIQKERLIIHGSAILWGDKAVIISGKSGSGKSTLANALLCGGGVFMTDDIAAVAMEEGKVYAYPGYPQQKLTVEAVKARKINTDNLIQLPKDSGEDKYALRLKEKYCNEKKELHAIIVLQKQEVDKGSLKKITGSEKIKYFTNNLYGQRAYKTMGFSRHAFMESVQIASQVEIYQLVRPPEGMTIEDEAAMVREVLNPAQR